jgi:hypothetical protein
MSTTKANRSRIVTGAEATALLEALERSHAGDRAWVIAGEWRASAAIPDHQVGDG